MDILQALPEEALPDSMRELVELIGLPATLAIVEARGGIMLSVPKTVAETHWLVPLIGLPALEQLVAVYSGETIEIPRCAAALRALREQRIVQEAEHASNATLARRYGYTIRGIRKLRRRVEAARQANEQQHDMFAPADLGE